LSASANSSSDIDLDIVVPVFNEEQRLGATLRALTEHTATLPLVVRITVVDNGSVDRTAEVVDELAAGRPANTSVRLIGCARQGKGAAVRRGILAGTARWRGFCDADLSTPPGALTDVLAQLGKDQPVVIGSRRVTGAGYVLPQPLVRRVGSRTFRAMTRPLVGNVADTQCGFKFFTAEAAEQVFRRVTANGFAFDVEVLAVAKRLGYPVVEVPVRWTDAAGSSFKVWTHGRRVVGEVRAVRSALTRMV
jgi:glycosyltransferase involved in cell wall biosynthesis